jgi:phage-related protein (TIGR01555 family)
MVKDEKPTNRVNMDGWFNIITGMGTAKDKSTYSDLRWRKTSRNVAEALFSADEMGNKIARIIPYDGTREGVTWNMDKSANQEEVIKFIEKEFRRLKVWTSLARAWTLARVYGGAVIYMSISDGRSISQPVNWKSVKKINSLRVIDRWDLNHMGTDIISDISNPKFGTPRFYRYQPSEAIQDASEIVIHNSRLIRFDGMYLPSRLYVDNDYWHDSIYGSLTTAIRNYSTNHEAIGPIIAAIAQPVYKIEGLSEALAMGKDELILAKLKQVELMRSTSQAIVLDKEDDFTTVAHNVAGGKDLIDLTIQRLVAGSDIPHTRLLGQSPSGLGATGQAELINYYDSVKSMQELHLQEAIETLIEGIFSQNGAVERPEDLDFRFNPLFQQDRESEIKSRMMQAKVDTDYFNMGAVTVDEVARSRFGTGRYSYETVLDQTKQRVAGGIQNQETMGSPRKGRTASTSGQPTAGLVTGQKEGADDLAAL